MNKNTDQGSDGRKQLMRYAGMGAQFLVSIGIGVFAGLKADQWMNTSFPLLVWLLPLLIICGLMYQFFKETSSRK